MVNSFTFRSIFGSRNPASLGALIVNMPDFDLVAQLHRNTTEGTMTNLDLLPLNDYGHRMFSNDGRRICGRFGGEAANRKRGAKRRSKNAASRKLLQQQDAMSAREMIEYGLLEYEDSRHYEPAWSLVQELIANEKRSRNGDNDDDTFADGGYGLRAGRFSSNDEDYSGPHFGSADEDYAPRRQHHGDGRKNNRACEQKNQAHVINQRLSHGRTNPVKAEKVEGNTPSRVVRKQQMRGVMESQRPIVEIIRNSLFKSRSTSGG
jgi:hypothetical protein